MGSGSGTDALGRSGDESTVGARARAASGGEFGNPWNSGLEDLAATWARDAGALREMHLEAEQYYRRCDRCIGVPLVFVQVLVTSSLFASGTFPEILGNAFIFSAAAVSALAAGMAAVQQTLGYRDLSQRHHEVSVVYRDMRDSIAEELAYDRRDRESAKMFMDRCKTTTGKVEKSCPSAPGHIRKRYMSTSVARLERGMGPIYINRGATAGTAAVAAVPAEASFDASAASISFLDAYAPPGLPLARYMGPSAGILKVTAHNGNPILFVDSLSDTSSSFSDAADAASDRAPAPAPAPAFAPAFAPAPALATDSVTEPALAPALSPMETRQVVHKVTWPPQQAPTGRGRGRGRPSLREALEREKTRRQARLSASRERRARIACDELASSPGSRK
jgi:hypothetical protein